MIITVLHLLKMSPNMTLLGVRDKIVEYFKENNAFPNIIEMDIDDYVQFPYLFVNSNDLGTFENGYKFLGILIRPYYIKQD